MLRTIQPEQLLVTTETRRRADLFKEIEKMEMLCPFPPQRRNLDSIKRKFKQHPIGGPRCPQQVKISKRAAQVNTLFNKLIIALIRSSF